MRPNKRDTQVSLYDQVTVYFNAVITSERQTCVRCKSQLTDLGRVCSLSSSVWTERGFCVPLLDEVTQRQCSREEDHVSIPSRLHYTSGDNDVILSHIYAS